MRPMSTQHVDWTSIPADTFELRLAIARFHAGSISAKEAAERVGVSGQTWRNWEAGASGGAKHPAMLRYIAGQLGVDETWLRNGGKLKKTLHPVTDAAHTTRDKELAAIIPLHAVNS